MLHQLTKALEDPFDKMLPVKVGVLELNPMWDKVLEPSKIKFNKE